MRDGRDVAFVIPSPAKYPSALLSQQKVPEWAATQILKLCSAPFPGTQSCKSCGLPQEFIGYNPVPEPGTLLLFRNWIVCAGQRIAKKVGAFEITIPSYPLSEVSRHPGSGHIYLRTFLCRSRLEINMGRPCLSQFGWSLETMGGSSLTGVT
jgi:hypothetical protein